MPEEACHFAKIYQSIVIPKELVAFAMVVAGSAFRSAVWAAWKMWAVTSGVNWMMQGIEWRMSQRIQWMVMIV